MPLANNSTGAGTGDDYNYTNPAMVAGILSPADGDVYVYGYDDNRKQVVIRKVGKKAQVPHKGMTAHPVYTNNLLESYKKNAVVPRTVGATHNPQAAVPTVNDYLSAYKKNAVVPKTVGATHNPQAAVPTVNDYLSAYKKNAVVPKTVGAIHNPQATVPTTNDFLSTYQKNEFKPTVTDFLSSYVKNAVKPMVGSQQPTLSWADPERFKQALQNMSGDLRRGALHGKAGASAREEHNGKSDYLPLSIKRLKGLDENPVLNSWTHALHGKAGINEREDGKLQKTTMRLKGLDENPVLNSWTHALHGKAGIHEREEGKLQMTSMRLKGLNDNPVLNSWTHALHGKAGIHEREEGKLQMTSMRLKGLNDNPVLNSWTHALHGKAGIHEREDGKLQMTSMRLKGLNDNPVLNSWTHALHGKAGIHEREEGKLQMTSMRLKGLNDNPVLNSWTHALHGKAGIHEREEGKLQMTSMRLKGLNDNPVLNSWTHALHGLAGSQQARIDWASPERFKQMLRNMSGDFATGALHGKEGIFARDNGKLPLTSLRLSRLSNDPVTGSWTHALHGKAGIQNRESYTQKDSRTGQERTYNNLLPTTIQRLKALADDPVRGSWTHALHGKEGIHLRDSFTQRNSRTGTIRTYTNLLPTTILRLKGLSEDSVKGSWTHALHGRTGGGGLGNFTFNNGKFKTDRTKQIEDLRQVNKPMGALFGRAGIAGTGGFTFADGRFKSNHTKLLEDIRSAASFRSSGALHGKAGSNIRGTASTVNTKGQTLTFSNLLNPTVRRYEALRENPVLGSHTHALYGMAGTQQPGYSWESPDRFKKHLASMSGVKTGALHGRTSGISPTSGGMIDGLADMLKGMIFGPDSWPMTKFYFYVLIGGIEMGFQTVEGLEAEIGVIEYRDGNSPLLAKERIPGLVTYNKVTLKKGMFANDTGAANLFKEIATDRQYTKRRSILIAMLDHNHIPQFIWRYEGCFITKFTPANLDAESESEIAVEEMEFAGRSFTTETLLGMAAGLVGGALNGSVSLPF